MAACPRRSSSENIWNWVRVTLSSVWNKARNEFNSAQIVIYPTLEYQPVTVGATVELQRRQSAFASGRGEPCSTREPQSEACYRTHQPILSDSTS